MRVFPSLVFIMLSVVCAPVSHGQSNYACERVQNRANDALDELRGDDRGSSGDFVKSERHRFSYTKCSSTKNGVTTTNTFSSKESYVIGVRVEQDKPKEQPRSFSRENTYGFRQGNNFDCVDGTGLSELELKRLKANGFMVCSPQTLEFPKFNFKKESAAEEIKLATEESECVDPIGLTQVQRDAALIKGQKLCTPADLNWSKEIKFPTCRNPNAKQENGFKRVATGNEKELPMCKSSEALDQSAGEIGE